MSHNPKLPHAAGSWLEKKLIMLNALYHRFGRDGLKDQPNADVGLLLSAKELQLRDASTGQDLGEERNAATHRLELEIKDLKAYVKSRVGRIGLSELRPVRQTERSQPQNQQRQFSSKARVTERER
jgi:hypothetical protein